MPPIGLLLGGVDFKDLFIALKGSATILTEARATGVPVIAYGNFINTLINFLIVALVIFFVIRAYNRMRGVKVVTRPELEKPDVKIDSLEGGAADAGAAADTQA